MVCAKTTPKISYTYGRWILTTNIPELLKSWSTIIADISKMSVMMMMVMKRVATLSSDENAHHADEKRIDDRAHRPVQYIK